MKILMFPAYFAPENTSSNHLQMDLLEGFAQKGWNVQLYTPTPTRGIDAQTRKQYAHIKRESMYHYHVQVYRFYMFKEGRNPLMRAVRYILSNMVQYYNGCRTKDVTAIYASSTPPTQGMLCGLVKKRLTRKYGRYIPLIYNLQDVFPDSLVTTGLAKKDSLAWKLGRKIEDFTYRNADKIIVISNAMKENILEKGVPKEKIVVIPNWIDTDAVKPVNKEKNRLYEEFAISKEKFTVVYAGNFGAAQGADVVLDAAKLLPEIQFVIFGGGAEFEKTRRAATALSNVIIHPLLPQERVPEVYSLGDVCLVTCKKGVGNSGMPSKTWSIMACNRPVVAAFDTDSELAKILDAANAGICVEPENAAALARTIEKMKECIGQYTGGRDYVCKNASKTACVSRYIEVLECETKR